MFQRDYTGLRSNLPQIHPINLRLRYNLSGRDLSACDRHVQTSEADPECRETLLFGSGGSLYLTCCHVCETLQVLLTENLRPLMLRIVTHVQCHVQSHSH